MLGVHPRQVLTELFQEEAELSIGTKAIGSEVC